MFTYPRGLSPTGQTVGAGALLAATPKGAEREFRGLGAAVRWRQSCTTSSAPTP
ncbi:exported protein of unknown function [Nitrospira moscoviensis]|uniref:Uncharacterized protein n=1 Tax=Nitrospira moscoviensis TaxID=42253 RepID=A0A0K2GE52_NITMO|nr:exported protein of unknown function [Nitrospira moscoviensis]